MCMCVLHNYWFHIHLLWVNSYWSNEYIRYWWSVNIDKKAILPSCAIPHDLPVNKKQYALVVLLFQFLIQKINGIFVFILKKKKKRKLCQSTHETCQVLLLQIIEIIFHLYQMDIKESSTLIVRSKFIFSSHFQFKRRIFFRSNWFPFSIFLSVFNLVQGFQHFSHIFLLQKYPMNSIEILHFERAFSFILSDIFAFISNVTPLKIE